MSKWDKINLVGVRTLVKVSVCGCVECQQLHFSRTVKWREQQQKNSLIGFETAKIKNVRPFSEQTVAARNDVTAKKLLANCFKTFSGRPEDWTISGPCHL